MPSTESNLTTESLLMEINEKLGKLTETLSEVSEGLKGLAKKEDLQNLANKNDLQKMELTINAMRSEQRIKADDWEQQFGSLRQQFNRFSRITESRLDNLQVVRNLPPSHFMMDSHSAYVEQAKPDYANFLSEDTIEPLPRYYR